MRYWFCEITNTVFPLDGEPPDGKGKIEISEEDYRATLGELASAAVEAADASGVDVGPSPVRVTVVTQPPAATVDMEKLARVWRKMQDKRDALSHAYKLADLEIENQQDKVGAALLDAMNKMGGTRLITPAGTIEKSVDTKVSGADWQAIYRFIKENDAWELLHKRLGSKFVVDWQKKTGSLPPGVNVYTAFKVSVKKPGSKEPPSEES